MSVIGFFFGNHCERPACFIDTFIVIIFLKQTIQEKNKKTYQTEECWLIYCKNPKTILGEDCLKKLEEDFKYDGSVSVVSVPK